jgi:hypothetical protein
MKNKSFLLSKAIQNLRPGSEFSFIDDDYSTIKWDVLNGDAPTQAEIDAALNQLKADEIAEAEAKAAQKATLLERLGITEEEAKLLLA